MIERLGSAIPVINSARVLSAHYLPKEVSERILFGDKEMLQLSKIVRFEKDEKLNNLIEEFRVGKSGFPVQEIKQRLSVLPISSAECKRGFSSLNIIHTKIRNRLQEDSRLTFLFLNINGPEMGDLDAHKYAQMWLREGRHSATESETGRKQMKHNITTKTLLI
jgi:hypothetical protein